MGSKLTKSQTTSMTEETTIEHEKILPATTSKTIEKKTITKKKEEKSKRKGSKSKVDQSTNTDHYLLISASGPEYLVGNQPLAAATAVLHSEQINSAYQSESHQDDAEQLRQTCIRNGILTEGSTDSPIDSCNKTNENEEKIEEHS